MHGNYLLCDREHIRWLLKLVSCPPQIYGIICGIIGCQ
jgi:hypothetical protein